MRSGFMRGWSRGEMRAFVGIPLPEDLTDRLEELAVGLRFGRAVPAENMHVTLAFLDEQPEEVLADLHEALAGMHLPAPHLEIDGLDVFGGDKPRLLFARVVPDAGLSDLRAKVRQAAGQVGIALKHERFRPHITLRRFSRLSPHERLELVHFFTACGGFAWPGFAAPDCVLYASHLTQDGAQYDRLATYPLRA